MPCVRKKAEGTKAAAGVWKAKSVFLDLPYWHILATPHCLDVMHITKNVCESLVGNLLNMSDKSKDGPKARNDLKHMNIREDLQGGRPEESNEEPDGHKAKRAQPIFPVPSRGQSAIRLLGADKQIPRPEETKLQRDESHECHVLMT